MYLSGVSKILYLWCMALEIEARKLHVAYVNQKEKKIVICKDWPKIKGAELRKGGRKYEGPKIKGAEN